MTVYILSRGEVCEGSSIHGVYKTEAKALKAIREIKAHFGDKTWKLIGPNEWQNGCDYVIIEEWELQ